MRRQRFRSGADTNPTQTTKTIGNPILLAFGSCWLVTDLDKDCRKEKKLKKLVYTHSHQLVKNTWHRDRIIKILGQSSNPINAASGQARQGAGGRRARLLPEACVDTIPYLPTFGRMFWAELLLFVLYSTSPTSGVLQVDNGVKD